MPTKREQFMQSLRAQYLGERMRELRDDLGLTLKYVSEYLGVEFSTLARYERAEWPFRKDHVTALLDVYNVYDEEDRLKLVKLAEHAWRVNQWQLDGIRPADPDRPVVDRWWVQQRTKTIHVYGATVIPDVMQVGAYANTLAKPFLPEPVADHTVRAAAHTAEQRRPNLYDREVEVHAVIEQAALTRRIGAREVMQAQLEHLTRLARLPNVQIQILDSTGAHPGVHGPFTVYHLRAPYPPVACVDHLGGTLLLEGESAARYVKAFTELAKDHSRTDTESAAIIETLKEDL
ncbi:helix-turn-helix domain-containing protein [Phytohabitans aurantiacus]|uniref:HTH cro/C1-type domain-containing protein n=1 Tax=Phytohabitans aurantiacus TaxID=3016789 RepID=A0ABQ5RE86_9ACTN|nr:helix-turn-helix transcriptional regulator [Phytohabitans aurantiacus]GLI03906.1 hypothetical protein Pa4123_91860 [Phytohabitans aurantiacus]